MRRFNAVMRAPIDLYAEPRAMRHIRRVYQHIFDRDNNVNDSFVAHLIAHEVEPESPLDLFGVRFTPIRLLHGRLPILGFRVEPAPGSGVRGGGFLPLGYCTDVSAVPPETWRHLDGLGTLVLDALRFRSHPTHLTIDEAVELSGRVAARQTWFVHMSNPVVHAEVDPTLPPGVNLAYDGLELR